MTEETRNTLILGVATMIASATICLTIFALVYVSAWRDIQIEKIRANAPQQEEVAK